MPLGKNEAHRRQIAGMVVVQWLLYLQLINFDLKVYLTLFYFKSRSVVYICDIVQSTHTAVIDSQLLK